MDNIIVSNRVLQDAVQQGGVCTAHGVWHARGGADGHHPCSRDDTLRAKEGGGGKAGAGRRVTSHGARMRSPAGDREGAALIL